MRRYSIEPSESREWKWQVVCACGGQSTKFGATSLRDAVSTLSKLVEHDIRVEEGQSGIDDSRIAEKLIGEGDSQE